MEERQAHISIWDATQLRILDTAERLIAQRGVGGLTIAELAREAGVSRPTIYRSWAGADEVVRAALLHRMLTLLEDIPVSRSRAQIVADVLRFSAAFLADPVYAALLDREPEVFTRYMLHRFGASQRAILQRMAESIAAAQAGGTVRAGDPRHVAVMLMLLAQSAILSHGTVSELIDDDAWDRELRATLDGILRP
ncbi:AcrR family transcriptional regulator [Microbacterium sp. W4I4]|uniref:TetR/AcrR family transcriptional regulator n=1 Tax=Microbacterium sp. W4I4 TaxID=3042295 RepID=UPI002780FAFD|nr:TetR/AcrR family transcriptional regulator [Microbacterium sp. W4I4]MDQ0612762.1 AcrR family transcriptional regulator [Microbacterium sp. W4I4]